MPPPRERTLTPPIERPTTLPAASRIVEDIGDPASSLRAAQDGNTRRLAGLQDVPCVPAAVGNELSPGTVGRFV